MKNIHSDSFITLILAVPPYSLFKKQTNKSALNILQKMALLKLSDCSPDLLRRQGDSKSPESAVSFGKLPAACSFSGTSLCYLVPE